MRNYKKTVSDRVSKKLSVTPSGKSIDDLGNIEGQKGRLTAYEYVLVFAQIFIYQVI